MGAAARALAERALRVAGHRRAAGGDLRARRRAAARRGRLRDAALRRSRATRGRAGSSSSPRSSRRSSRSGGAGRTGTPSTTRSTSSAGAGSSSASLLNLLSVLARALAWNLTIHQALAPPLPTLPPGVLGVRRRVCSETPCSRRGRASSRGSPCSGGICRTARDERDAARHGVRAPAVRPLPDRAAGRLRRRDGEAPALGGHRRW